MTERDPEEMGSFDPTDAVRSSGWFLAIGAAALVVVVFVGSVVFVVAELLAGDHGYGKPWPEFPTLAAEPNPSFRGTVAFIAGPSEPRKVESDGQVTMRKDSCAMVVRASGGRAQQVMCWPMPDRELASVAWTGDGRLRITGFEEGQKAKPIPIWGREIDLSTGENVTVAIENLATDAFPEPPPVTNLNDETLVVRNGRGSATVTVVRSGSQQVLFSVKDQNPGFAIQGTPQWSSDGKWFVMYDGRRLLTTTNDAAPSTKVLAENVSGAIGEWGATTFALTTREW